MKSTLNAFLISIAVLLGLTPASASAAPTGKVLVVLSGVDYVTLKDGSTHPTGYFLPELAGPLKGLIAAGYEVTFANPTGREPKMDRVSDSARWFKSEAEYLEAKKLLSAQRGLKSPRKLSALTEAELNGYDGLFLPGGHAPMEDLYRDAQLGRILRHFHAAMKPTALICHAPVALLSARQGKSWIYSGYQMTVFSNAEEKQEEDSGHLDGYLTFYVADALSAAGAKVSTAEPWKSHAVRDRELITGQNPMSEDGFTPLFIEALTERLIKSRGRTQPWKVEARESMRINPLYDAATAPTDWKSGYTTVFIGRRLPSEHAFLAHLQTHVDDVRRSFGPMGLRGYVLYATAEHEFAIQNLVSAEAAQRALESAEGKRIVADAATFFDFVLFKQADSAQAWWFLGAR